MMRRTLFLIATIVMTLAVWFAPAHAAGSPWAAWLYESTTGRMTQVDDTGATLHQFILPADTGSSYSRNISVSADGVLLAYMAANTNATYLNIYDLTTNTVVYNYQLPANIETSLSFSAGPFNFSDGDSTFAFGYTSYETPWQIVIIDLITFTSSVLNQGDPPVAAIISGNGFMLPVVTYNRDQDIKFMMIPLGTEGAPSYDAYTWNTVTNSVAPNAAYVTPDTDTFALTNEVISTLSDPRFPESTDPISGYPSSNTLQVFDPASSGRFVVTSLSAIYNPHFIQGGERIAVIQYDSIPDAVQTQSLQVLERSGTVSGTVSGAPSTDITSMVGTLNGFIFTAGGSSESAGSALSYVETRLTGAPFAAVPIWNNPSAASTSLVWVSDSTPLAASAFTPWGRLAPSAVAAPTTPPIAPPASSIMAVGREATVQTTAGDVLNLRSGPARSFARIGTVSNGTIVTLLEGPTAADDFIWWRVRLSTGVEGWVVDAADGIQTLIPR